MTKAIAYLRTSSAANVGGDSDVRQRTAIEAYAAATGVEIVAEFYDAAVSGADHVESRAGFSAMLDRIEGNGVRMILVEDASRFARDLTVQELGIVILQSRGVALVTAGGDNLTDTSDPVRVMFRQIAGAFAQFEKARMVLKLKGARDRKSAELGTRVEGVKAYRQDSPVVAEVGRLRGTLKRPTLQAITDALKAGGYTTTTGKPIALNQVARIVRTLKVMA